jgi:hypothetical protein
MFNLPEGISSIAASFLLNSVKISPVAHTGFYPKGTARVFIPSEVNVTESSPPFRVEIKIA